MKHILITGGAGFIGINLTKKLLSQGHKITVLDNLYTGFEENVENLKTNSNFQFINQDINTPLNGTYDYIINLACPASPPNYQKNPIYTFKTSVIGTLNVLELAKKTKAKILHASTSEIYGDPLVHPQSEDYFGNVNPIGVRSCYDEGKRAAETLCYDYYHFENVDVRMIRIFNTYGPYMDPSDGRVVSNFINQALKNEDITIYGEGLQTRSFQYIDDLIDVIVLFMFKELNEFTVLNTGNPDEFTVFELAESVLKLIPESKSKIVFKKLPSDDPKRRKPDITKAKILLGWTPKIKLEEGLQRTINYFKIKRYI